MQKSRIITRLTNRLGVQYAFFESQTMPPILYVVAGILFNEQGEFLLSSRPEGKPYAGYWEFAGGKIEAGETPFTALQREFMEELGIYIHSASAWLAKFYRYEHAHVHLRFFRIESHEWHGTLQARENQRWAWQRAGEFSVAPMLPANTALLKALAIPRQFSGCLKTGLRGNNNTGEFHVVPYAQACKNDQHILLEYAIFRTLPHIPNAPEYWVIVDNSAQFQAACNADAIVWRVDKQNTAHEALTQLQSGAPMPIIIASDLPVDTASFAKHGAQAIVSVNTTSIA